MKSDASSQSDKPTTPFERFEELARRLIAVPKHEIDKEAEQEDGHRKLRKMISHKTWS